MSNNFFFFFVVESVLKIGFLIIEKSGIKNVLIVFWFVNIKNISNKSLLYNY